MKVQEWQPTAALSLAVHVTPANMSVPLSFTFLMDIWAYGHGTDTQLTLQSHPRPVCGSMQTNCTNSVLYIAIKNRGHSYDPEKYKIW